ncbi:MAG: hypothetical protein AAF628_36710 [Planctomycetota bacterium]
MLADRLPDVPELPIDPFAEIRYRTWRDIIYRERDGVGYLHFDFYSGAMSTRQCERLRDAVQRARRRPMRVLGVNGREATRRAV